MPADPPAGPTGGAHSPPSAERAWVEAGEARGPDGHGGPAAGGPAAGDQAGDDQAAGEQPVAGQAAAPEPPEPTLPEPVRARVVALAAAAMTGLGGEDIPSPLRKVARFAPQRRARYGAAPIAAQLAGDARFRQMIGSRVSEDAGELAAAVASGTTPGAADPVELAALAYLIRPPGWRGLVARAGAELRAEADAASVAGRVREAEARATQAEYDREVARVEADKLRAELTRVRDELKGLRDEHRATVRALRESESREQRASALLATEKGRTTRATADHEAELRRLRGRLAETEAAVGAARSAAKESRTVDDARLWLLLETISQAATGLRRELALDPATVLPADLAADEEAAQRPGGPGRQPARALPEHDPARLDQLLALPRAHLVVDGYNVTKRGYGELDLEHQRHRLVHGLSTIAAQTGTEVTVAFDGAERVPGLPPAPRGVRVLFSRKGQTADELIRKLVRAEPDGRPVIVISSDREVADGVRRAGAYPLPADVLLRRMART